MISIEPIASDGGQILRFIASIYGCKICAICG